MLQYIEQFIDRPIAKSEQQEEAIAYYDATDELVAVAYYDEGECYSVEFHGGTDLQVTISIEQAEVIARHVQVVFEQQALVLEEISLINEQYVAHFKVQEPVYGLLVRGTGMMVTLSASGFVEEVRLHGNDYNIHYPDKLISKEEARAIIQQQPLLQRSISQAHGWQYVYGQNYDLHGVAADGTVKRMSEDEIMQDASFELLPEVAALEVSFEVFLIGGRTEPLETHHTEAEQRWTIWTEDGPIDGPVLDENHFTRACKVVKALVGDAYGDYYVERYPTLKQLMGLADNRFETYRFVYIVEGISFDFQAIAVEVDKETNQIMAVSFTPIPFERLKSLQKPKLSHDEANAIAAQLVDVELFLEADLHNSRQFTVVYLIDYPTSPTQGHIQFVDAFTGEVHWVNTGW